MRVRALRRLAILLVACGLVAANPALGAGYVDERPGFGAMLVDGVVVRPLGLGAMVLGAATWVVTLPFSALGGNVDEATQKLVVDPARFTFVRPIGEL